MKIYQWLTFILLAVVVCLIFFWPKPQPSAREVELIQSNELLEVKAANAIKASQAIVIKMEQDSLEDLEALKRFEIENKRLRKELSKKRVVVQHVIDTMPTLKVFVEQQDSLIQLQAVRIDSLIIEKQVMDKNYTLLIAAKDQELAAVRQVNANMDEILKLKNKDLRKQRTGNKLWKGLAIVGTVGGVFLGSR